MLPRLHSDGSPNQVFAPTRHNTLHVSVADAARLTFTCTSPLWRKERERSAAIGARERLPTRD
eukprot:6282383-Prymnesium_polylepis.1